MSPQSLLPILTLLLVSLSHATAAATYLLPVVKDSNRLQYYTSFTLGTPPARVYLAIDLGNPTNWIVGSLTGYNQSSSYKSVSHNTPECLAYSGPQAAWNDCSGPHSPTCNLNQCDGWASNPLYLDFTFSHGAYGLDPVVMDVLSPIYRLGDSPAKTPLPLFPFVDTTVTGPLKGLSQYTKGIVSLARNPMALHSQISSAFKVPRKFALCLPSSAASGLNGAIYFGGGPYVLPPSTVDLSASFASTPLVSNSHSVLNAFEPADPAVEYYIKINSILIDGAPVKFNTSLLSIDRRGDGGVKLSSMVHYTKLHSAIYTAFVSVFVQKARALNMAFVGPVGAFKTCFKTGSGVPVIELAMAGKARWRIYGSNSMVKVSSDVQCLAIVDAGPKPANGVTPAVVIGGKQMEDSLVEFDLVASKVGVVSSLRRFGTSCSQFKGI